MDQTLVDSIRKSLETKSTQELRQAYDGDKGGKSAEEVEAMRQVLEERRTKSNRFVIALASACIFGSLAGALAGWQFGPDIVAVLAGLGGAILGFVSWYIPGLISQT
jgi:hypothetical protein